ncbi:MAG: hypothetical protein WBH60_03850 [Fervidobacterium sp.]
MIFGKLFELVDAFKNHDEFKKYEIVLINPQPVPKPNRIMLGLTSFEAPKQTWGQLRKSGILSIVVSKQLLENGQEYDAVVSQILELLNGKFDIVELTDLDFLSIPASKLIFIYLGFKVEWV